MNPAPSPLSRGLRDVLDASEMLTLFASAKSHPGVNADAAKAIHGKLVDRLNVAMHEATQPLPETPAELDENGEPVTPVDVAALQAELAEAKAHVESLQAAQTVLADELTEARAALAAPSAPPADAPPAG